MKVVATSLGVDRATTVYSPEDSAKLDEYMSVGVPCANGTLTLSLRNLLLQLLQR